jgi:chemotaxis family two-component system sensor kinase Cph1
MSRFDPTLALTECEREPIHIPGAVQPHGLLLAVDPASGRVIQVAGATVLVELGASSVVGRPVVDLLGADVPERLTAKSLDLRREPAYLGAIRAAGGELDVLAHERDGVWIFELEPAAAPRASAADALAQVRAVSLALDAAADLRRVCEVGAREMRRLSGFDRVMIYRFLEDGAGYVFAEEKRFDLPPFLNHHYPASDIPRQARELYLRNIIRVIPDVAYEPAPLVPPVCPVTGRPLDMSDCILRSVSPIHVQYLKNMGVASSMSVSIVRGGALWGLIACHHTTPRHVSFELREICKQIGQMLSQQIATREEAERSAQMLRLREAQDQLLAELARGDAIDPALLRTCAELTGIIPADGAAIFCGGEVTIAGHCPPADAVRALAKWRLDVDGSDVYASDRLSEAHAAATAYQRVASGMLAAVISRETPLVTMWFRAERIQTVMWAGNPHKPVEPGTPEKPLSPRQSFAQWEETVRGRSRPWSAAEINAAQRFRDALFELRRQDQIRTLNRELRRTLADKEELLVQKDLLMREIHHRVQNSLQLAGSLLRLQALESGAPEIQTQFEEARRRLAAMGMVHRRLYRSDQIQTVDLDRYLRELRDELIPSFGAVWDKHIRVHGAPAPVSADKAVAVGLTVTELVTNAVKYAYGGGVGPIDITVRPGDSTLEVRVDDQGVGLPATRREGFGSRLTHALVSKFEGRIEMRDNRPGTRVVLRMFLDRPAEDAAHRPEG